MSKPPAQICCLGLAWLAGCLHNRRQSEDQSRSALEDQWVREEGWFWEEKNIVEQMLCSTSGAISPTWSPIISVTAASQKQKLCQSYPCCTLPLAPHHIHSQSLRWPKRPRQNLKKPYGFAESGIALPVTFSGKANKASPYLSSKALHWRTDFETEHAAAAALHRALRVEDLPIYEIMTILIHLGEQGTKYTSIYIIPQGHCRGYTHCL